MLIKKFFLTFSGSKWRDKPENEKLFFLKIRPPFKIKNKAKRKKIIDKVQKIQRTLSRFLTKILRSAIFSPLFSSQFLKFISKNRPIPKK
ncbi:Predicted protein [Mesomycoplasma hyopneumoniae 168]|uniref:Uncharacterized protein n=1 Tax=Mesomycoplasma hyopneumoniae (strain 168) TaxID=907287 RepID=E4QTG7_MESH1|nr:Predicted protein [Mesomycoplasma hyopneumoniae 168]